MMYRLALLSLVVLLFGCARAEDGVPLARRMFKVSKDVAAEQMEGSVLPQAQRRKRKRWGATAMYIDGQFIGMLRFPELPPQLETRVEKLDIPDEDIYVRRFVWGELFAVHGVDLEAIKAVHFYGGRNFIQVVEGDEFRRVGDTFRFNFTQGTGGKPRQRPPAGGMEYNTGIDIIRAVVVYVAKEPPTYDRGKITFPDGTVVGTRDERGRMVIPYSDGERHGGTRVYMDGKYIDAFRRRALGTDLLADQRDASASYLLGNTLKSFGVDLEGVHRIELWDSRDELAGVIEGAGLSKLETLSFALGQHSRGRIQVPEIGEEKLAAVVVYKATEPADRTIPTGGGSRGDQPAPKKSNDSAQTATAQKVQ